MSGELGREDGEEVGLKALGFGQGLDQAGPGVLQVLGAVFVVASAFLDAFIGRLPTESWKGMQEDRSAGRGMFGRGIIAGEWAEK